MIDDPGADLAVRIAAVFTCVFLAALFGLLAAAEHAFGSSRTKVLARAVLAVVLALVACVLMACAATPPAEQEIEYEQRPARLVELDVSGMDGEEWELTR